MTEQQTHLGTTANGYVLNRTASDRTNTKPESRVHKRRPRKPVSCVPCRDSKLKCDRQYPCASCKRRRCVESCFYYSRNQNNTQNTPVETTDRSASTWLPIQQYSRLEASIGSSTQNLSELLPEPVQADTTTPSQHDTHTQWDALLQRPIGQICQSEMSPNDPLEHTGNFCFPFSFGHAVSKQDILAILPPAHCCDYLVTEYFTRLSPLFHILHGPTFQKQYNEFRQDASAADLSWIALLFAICSATMSSLESDDSVLADIWPDSAGPHDISAVAYRFRTATMICLSQDQFLIRHNLSTLEALLLLIYAISNHEGAERAWTLLGLTLNIGISLKCNDDAKTQQLNCIDTQRRRRCWAGILLLHTYQATFFRDIDMSALLNIEATMPEDVNDNDIKECDISAPSSQPTQMSLMRFKIQMFQLSTKICRHLSSSSKHNEALLSLFDSQVAEEQRQWDTIFLLDGSPSLLDSSSYAHWCILQLYAHQLYLLLHRPFCKPHSPCFRSASRAKCIISGTALLDVHRLLYELPRLRHYRWLLSGLTSFYAIHGAIALASCLLDEPDTVDLSPYRPDFDAAVARIYKLRNKSHVCAKAFPILNHLQFLLSKERSHSARSADIDLGVTFNEWIDDVQWINPDSIDWTFWDNVLNTDTSREAGVGNEVLNC